MPLSLINRSNGNGKLDLLQRGSSLGGLRMFTVSTGGGGGLDADATAFIEAAGITDETQKSAINTLVTDLKSYGIWTKMKAIYPFVGGTATTHKWNLKDPRDLDVAYRLQFFGGWVHSATGIKPNGSNAYANTFIKPANVFTLGSASGGAYSRENTATDSRNEYGCGIPFGNSPHFAMRSRLAGFFYADTWSNGTAGRIQVATSDTLGLSSVSRTAANVYKAFRQGVQFGTTNTNTETQTNLNQLTMDITIGAFNTNTGGQTSYLVNEQAFTFFGDGLTDAEVANLYTAVQAYQTSLGRQV